MKIGLFDSGLGGLTILKAVARELPWYDYEFYGDTANLPYGDRNEKEIYELTKKGVEYLFAKECSLVIIACNTSSAETLRKLQDGFLRENYSDRKILGVIIPTIEAVIEQSLNRVVLIGTNRTVNSKKYLYELAKYPRVPELVSVATPDLVPLIEAGEFETAFSNALEAIEQTGEKDGVILGCTHYTILTQKLTAYYATKSVQVFSQDHIIPTKLKNYLENHPEIETKLTREGQRNIYLTDNSSRYDSVIQELLGGAFIADNKGGD